MAVNGRIGKEWNAVWIVFFLFGFMQQKLPAQTVRSTQSGVYTTSQALQGKAIYMKKCSMCHGATLQGRDENPQLAGDDFLDTWDGQSLANLDIMIHTTMPASHPGSLTQEETTKILAYLLSANKFPSGKTALPSSLSSLKSIQIQKHK